MKVYLNFTLKCDLQISRCWEERVQNVQRRGCYND